jgi:hypothetical protein
MVNIREPPIESLVDLFERIASKAWKELRLHGFIESP